MDSVEEFLVHAARLEQEAALRFDQLADAATSFGNREVAEFFRQMAHFSRLHLQQARDRGGFRDLPEIAPGQFQWSGEESPEAAAIWGADPSMDVIQAMDVALEAEKRGLIFYAGVLSRTTDPQVRVLAREFVEEEAEHVRAIERWIARLAA